MAKKKHYRRRPNMVKKVIKGVADGVSYGLMAMPVIIPAVQVGRELAGGHTISYSMNTATQAIAGISVDGGDMTPDFGKLTKYAIGTGAMVATGVLIGKFLIPRLK